MTKLTEYWQIESRTVSTKEQMMEEWPHTPFSEDWTRFGGIDKGNYLHSEMLRRLEVYQKSAREGRDFFRLVHVIEYLDD